MKYLNLILFLTTSTTQAYGGYAGIKHCYLVKELQYNVPPLCIYECEDGSTKTKANYSCEREIITGIYN